MKTNWRQVILYIAVLGMEGCWLYALMAMMTQVVDGHLSALAVVLLYPVAFGFNKLLLKLEWPGFYLLTISWLVWVIAMLLLVKAQLFGSLPWSDTRWLLAVPRAIANVFYAFRPELLVLISSAVIWWLGRRLASLSVRFATLVSEFQFGLVILLITFFIASQLEVKLADSVQLILVFFLFALTGIPVAHTLEGESWLSGLYRGHWSGLLLVSIGVVILLGLLVSWIVTPDFIQIVIDGLKWLWGLIMKAVAFLISLFPEPEPAELPPEMPMTGMEAPEEDISKIWTMPAWLRSGLQTGWIIVFTGLIIIALWRVSSEVFSWLRRRLSNTAGAEFEAVPTNFGADLLNLLKRVMRMFFRVRLLFRFRRKSATILPEVAPVRQIYRQFLRWAASGGYARSSSQTPLEYLMALSERVPEAQPDLLFITQRYIAVRYGAWLPGEDEIQRLRQSWHRVKKSRLRKADRGPSP